jgi:hypothetical protein
MAEDVKSIIDYYATPVTVITGGTVGNLKRGLGEVWSGLPAEANVSTLSLNADTNASITFLDKIRQAIHDLSGVPEEVLSKVQHISNTSSAALKMLYHSLIMAADRKILTYSIGLEEINRLTMMYNFLFFSNEELNANVIKLKPNLFYDRFVAEPIFNYGLPNDRMVMLQEAQIELQSLIGSRREIMERMGKKNIPKIMDEIEDDVKLKQEAQGTEAQKTGFSNPKLGIDQNKLKIA